MIETISRLREITQGVITPVVMLSNSASRNNPYFLNFNIPITTENPYIDDDTVSMLRKLAVYAGICHVRTPEGSSYAANVDVSESRETRGFNIVPKYTLSVTRVDSQALDGITYDQWLEKRVEEEEEEEE